MVISTGLPTKFAWLTIEFDLKSRALIKPTQASSLSVVQLKALTKEQVQALPATLIKSLSVKQKAALAIP